MSNLIIIDIGSGPHPKQDATIRMDLHQWPGVTHLHNLYVFPYPFEDNYADKIYFNDVIEHMIYLVAENVLKEIYRILKPGSYLDITCPDVQWIMERIVYNDWNEKANVDWLRKNEDPWENAMDYLFGGFRNPEEYNIPGMGHVNGFNETSLTKLLAKVGFTNIQRIPDDRNPEPARGAVLKLIAYK